MDPYTGELCIVQRVCLANPDALVNRLVSEKAKNQFIRATIRAFSFVRTRIK